MTQLVGGHFDLEMNFIIQEPESIVCMVELLDKCEPTCQAEVWSIFTAILKKSVRNLQVCTEVGLIQQVLQQISTTESMIAGTENSVSWQTLFLKLILHGTNHFLFDYHNVNQSDIKLKLKHS